MRRSALVEWQDFTAQKFNFISDIENGDPLFEDIDKVITYHKENPGDSLLDIYWEIGQYIVMYEQYGSEKSQYGEKCLSTVAKLFTQKYGKGFSRRNIINMRRLYKFFPIRQTPFNEQLTWSHFNEILKAATGAEASFYKEQAELNRWSVRQLRQQMSDRYYYTYTLFSVLL